MSVFIVFVKNKIAFQSKMDHPWMPVHVFCDACITFASVTLTLTRWPWYTNSAKVFERCTGLHSKKKKFLDQNLQELGHGQNRETHTPTEATWLIITPHSHLVKLCICVYMCELFCVAAGWSNKWWCDDDDDDDDDDYEFMMMILIGNKADVNDHNANWSQNICR